MNNIEQIVNEAVQKISAADSCALEKLKNEYIGKNEGVVVEPRLEAVGIQARYNGWICALEFIHISHEGSPASMIR